jgi:hypothetical protein
MLERLRAGLTFANVISVLALVFAMGGGAYAFASSSGGGVIHGCVQKTTGGLRVISGKQKCGKSEKAITWNRTGPRGLQGRTGAQGLQGSTGATGPFPDILPTGKTVRGNYNIGGTAANGGALANTAISFVFQFASAPAFNYIAPGGASTAACPGSATNPTAAPGNLCVYSQGVTNTTGAMNNNIDQWGDTLFINATAPGTFFDFGIWAATSP